MRPQLPHTSAAPLHLEEPTFTPEPPLEVDVQLPHIVLDRSLWRPVAVIALVVSLFGGAVELVRYCTAEVDRAARELYRGGFGQS